MTQHGIRPLPRQLRDSITRLFGQRVRDGVAPGGAFVLFDREGVVLDGGFGERSIGGAAPDAETAFRIASCTKSFTAATLLVLRDRGELNLDAPITEFVPEFVATAPRSAPVIPTVRMLMTMSAGLPTDDPWGDRQESISNARLAEILGRGVPFSTVPGTAFEYSNLGYSLLGQVVERVTGRRYIDVVAAEIFAPLGLGSIGYDEHAVAADRLARGYRRSEGGWLELPFSPPGAFSSIGGIFATPSELARWARWLGGAFDPDDTVPGPLSAATRREMQQIQRSIARESGTASGRPGGYGYGFGLFVEEDPVWGTTVFHSGGYPGFGAHMRWNVPSGLGIVALENATYSGARTPATAALQLAVEHLGAPRLSPEPWPETVALQAGAERLLRAWDDAVADEIFAENISLDAPYPERIAGIAAELARVGGIDWSRPAEDSSGESPAHRVWRLPARRGRVRCEILLAPTTPASIQTFRVTAEPPD